MSDPTCFKFIINCAPWNYRSTLKAFGVLRQVYVKKDNPKIVFIKFNQESEATRAKSHLLQDERVVAIKPMKDWPFPAAKNQEGGSKKANESSESVSNEAADSRSSVNNNIGVPPPMLCSNCRRLFAAFMCSVCATWYCHEQCQLADWPNHRMNCIPRLVRGYPMLTVPYGSTPKQMASGSARPSPKQKMSPSVPPPQQVEKKENVAVKPNKAKLGANNKSPINAEPKGPESLENKPADLPKKKTDKKANKQLSGDSPVQVPSSNGLDDGDEDKTEKPPIKANALAVVESSENTADETSDEQHVPQEMPPTEPTIVEPKKQHRVSTSMLMRIKQMKVAGAKRLLAYDPFPPVGQKVSISFVSDIALYVHPCSEDSSGPPGAYLNFMKRSMEHANEVKQQLQQPPTEGDIVFAPFDDAYYRAITGQVNGDSVSVFFVDFGNSDTLHWKLLKEIEDTNVKYANCLTHAVSIAIGTPFTPAVRNFLTAMIEEEVFDLVEVKDVPESKTKMVELRHAQENYILSAKLRDLVAQQSSTRAAPTAKATKLIVPDPATYKPVSGEEFEDPIISTDDEAKELLIMEASDLSVSGQVAAIFTSDNMAFGALLKECEQYGEMDPNPYQPEENYACLVLYDGAWSRAIYVEGQYYLLDMGLVRELDAKQHPIRRYPATLSRKMYCSDFAVDNPDILQKVFKGNVDDLRGRRVKAKVHMGSDGVVFHLTIVTIT